EVRHLPSQDAIEALLRPERMVFVDHGVIDAPLPQVDLPLLYILDEERPAFLGGVKQLQKVRQRDLLNAAGHGGGLVAARRMSLGGLLKLFFRFLLVEQLRILSLVNELEDGGADENPIPLLQSRLANFFTVDERALGRAKVFDHHLAADGA